MFEDWGTVTTDPYQQYHPQDTDLWLKLLSAANGVNPELYAILDYLRGAGTILVQNSKFGYKLQPLINENAWQSIEQYQAESIYLQPYKNELIDILGGL